MKNLNDSKFNGVSDDIIEKQMINMVEKNNRNVSKLPLSNQLVLDALEENEIGDAILLVKCLKNRYAYDHANREWYYWNKHHWRLDKINHITTLTREVVILYGQQQIYESLAYKKAVKESDEKAKDLHLYFLGKLKERISQLRTLKRISRVLELARSGLDSLAVTGEDWDKQPMLLGCRNGCIDLKTGEFRDGRPEDYIRLVSPIKWAGDDAPKDKWEKFLSQVYGGDQDMVDYIQRLFGYGITGLTTEHIFPIFWGPKGRNGKSTLFETLKYVLGELAYKAPSDFIMDRKNRGNGTGPDAVTMGLIGKRIFWFSETNENDRLDVAKLKEMSGGDTLSARAPHGRRQVEFTLSALMLTLTNKKPRVPHNDPALWERIHLISHENSFLDNPDPNNPNQFKSDKKLNEKLKKQAPGILLWLVQGCLLYQEFGLLPPAKVHASTKEYQQSQDIFGHFISECCITGSDQYKVSPKKIHESYKLWCDEVGHHPMARNRMIDDLVERFGPSVMINGYRYFKGVSIVNM